MSPVRNIAFACPRSDNKIFDLTCTKKTSGGLKITIKNLQKKIPINPKNIKKAFLAVLSQEGIRKSGEITVCFVKDRKIKELNLRYLGENNPTDVIAFDVTEKNKESKQDILADIVISTDRVVANARIFNTTASYELYLYVIHGMLHLLGYNDRTARQRKVMASKASRIMSALSI